MPAHLFAYQLEYGLIPRLGWTNTGDAVLCHQCDFTGCVNPAHMLLGRRPLNAVNCAASWVTRFNVVAARATPSSNWAVIGSPFDAENAQADDALGFTPW